MKLHIYVMMAMTNRLFIMCAMIPHKNVLNKIPGELMNEIFEFIDDNGIGALRLTCHGIKGKMEDYFRDRRFKESVKNDIGIALRLSVTRRWQLSCLLNKRNGDFTIKTVIIQVYNPSDSWSHVKLLRFLSIHPEFSEAFNNLRSDRRGFIDPMLKIYRQRVHGLEEFAEVMRVDVPVVRETLMGFEFGDDVCNEDLGVFYVLMKGFKLLY